MQDNMKRNNIHIIGIPEGEEEEHRESQARGTQRGPLQDTS